MRFALNAVAMHKQGGGSRHIEGLVEALGRVSRADEFVLCLDRRFALRSSQPNVTLQPVWVDTAWRRLRWDQAALPVWSARAGIDAVAALLNMGTYVPLVPQLSLQRNALYYCRAHLAQAGARGRRAISARRLMARLTMRASRLIVVPSLAMRDMIRSFHPDLPAARFRILPHGYAPSQVGRQPLPAALAERFAAVRDRPVLLYVSHLEPHKAHDVAIATLRALKRRGSNACLVVTMDRADWPEGYDWLMVTIEAESLGADVVNLGRVPETALDALYARADVFLFPSLCESFGFPMVEALGYRLPIVAADTAINRELCGEAALYYPPSDAVAAADQVSALLGSAEQRLRLCEVAAAQFPRSHLGWDDYARRFTELLHEAAAGAPSGANNALSG